MLGIDRLGYWANQYGFGAPTGIDLPGEVSGIVPTNQWKQDTLGAKIFPGETYQAGIGQGYDVVTPIQLINAYAALANGGKLYQPQVVREIVGPDGKVVRPFKPKLIRKLNVQPSVLRTMRNAARERGHSSATRTTSSTCRSRSPASPGTAEFGVRDSKGRLPFHSWFVGFVPEGSRSTGRSTSTDSTARRPRLRLRLADEGQRRDRDREVLPAAPLRDQAGLPASTSSSAATSTRATDGRHPSRTRDGRHPTGPPSPSGGALGRRGGFDLQLTTYAGLLVAIGLVMAYTNSVEDGSAPLEAGTTFSARPDVGRRSRSSSSSSRPSSTTTG